MPLTPESILIGIAQNALVVFKLTWWLIVPLVLGFIFWEFWLAYVRVSYFEGIKWLILRVKTPREILKSPKSMEQIFASAHATYSFGIKFLDKYWKGKVENWMSFEMVGDAGGVYFYVRIPASFRNLIESAIYSEYPTAEIEIAEDYTANTPAILPDNNYDLFGADFILAKESAYPIRTYAYFDSKVEEEKLDSIATITEVMSRLKEGEKIWLQLLIRPTGDEWKKEAEEIRDKLAGRKKSAPSPGLIGSLTTFFINLIKAPFEPPTWTEVKEEKPAGMMLLTEGERDVIKAIEEKASKIGFEGALRFIYIDDRKAFSRDNVAAVMGALRQFNALNLNSLRPDRDTLTIVRGLFKKRRIYMRKRKIYDAYRLRLLPKKPSVFNVEELATLYHYPSIIVEAPMLRPVEFKKGTPPTNLPLA